MESLKKSLLNVCITLCTHLFGTTHDIHVYINNHTRLTFDLSVKYQGTALIYGNDWKDKSKVLEPYQENTEANMIFAVNSYLPQGSHIFTLTLDDGIDKIRLTQKFISKSPDMPCYIELQPTDCLIKLVTREKQPIYILCTTQGLNIIYWIIEQSTNNDKEATSLINSRPQCSEKQILKIATNKNLSLDRDKTDHLEHNRQYYIPVSTLEILATLIAIDNTQLELHNSKENSEEFHQKDCILCSSNKSSMLGDYVVKPNPDMSNIVYKKDSSTKNNNVFRLYTMKEQQ